MQTKKEIKIEMIEIEIREKFEESIIQHMDAVHAAALRMTQGNIHEAQDILQDTFLKAYRFFDKFRQGSDARAWLLRILKNTFINEYRKKTKEPEWVNVENAEIYEGLTTETTPEDEVINKILDEDVAGAIAVLPDEFRPCVIMADIEGLSYKEIADFLSIPIGTVMSRLSRGRGLLKKALHVYAKKHGYLKNK